MKFQATVYETVVFLKNYYIEAEDEEDARRKAEIGETEDEDTVKEEGVVNREISRIRVLP
jgi:hypothetical protein